MQTRHIHVHVCTVEPLNADTPQTQIWTLSLVPIAVIQYKTTPELRTPLKLGQLQMYMESVIKGFHCTLKIFP